MKTTLEIPDDLLLKTEVSAASRGESLGDYVTQALRAQLRAAPVEGTPKEAGWRNVFGKADLTQVSDIDRIVVE